MNAIEFQTTVKNNIIEIPHRYLSNLTKRVRVILLVEGNKPAVNFIDELLAHPVQVKGFRSLTREEVYAR
ncbi:MAG: hypothetical protein AB1422_03960 [bacterium]